MLYQFPNAKNIPEFHKLAEMSEGLEDFSEIMDERKVKVVRNLEPSVIRQRKEAISDLTVRFTVRLSKLPSMGVVGGTSFFHGLVC